MLTANSSTPPSFQIPKTPILIDCMGVTRKPREVLRECAKVWEETIGPAAPLLRYPDKFPEHWENLCEQKGSGLIVAVFRVWAEEKGKWLLSQRSNFFAIGQFTYDINAYLRRVQVRP